VSENYDYEHIVLDNYEQQIVCSAETQPHAAGFPKGNRRIIATLDHERTIEHLKTTCEDPSDPELVEWCLIYRFTDSRGATVYYWPGARGLSDWDANPTCACGGGWWPSVDDWGDATEEEIENRLSMGHGGDCCESVSENGAVSQWCRPRA